MIELIDLDSVSMIDTDQLSEIESRDSVTVAYVRGRCTGAALALATAVDIVVAGPSAEFGAPGQWTDVFVRRGIGICGRSLTKYLAMTDRLIDSNRAQLCGLVNVVADDPQATAMELAEGIERRAGLAIRTIVTQAHRGAREDYLLSLTTDHR